MFNNLKEKFEIWYDDFMWKYSDERKELAHGRLKAHELAMKEGRNSPYTHLKNIQRGSIKDPFFY